MNKHHLTAADRLLTGAAVFPPHMAQYDGSNARGYEFLPACYVQLGAVKTAAATGLINAATGAELPNNATKTYTPATDGTSPLDAGTRATVKDGYRSTDGKSQVAYTLDVARNVSASVTHETSIVPMTITVKGADIYGQPQSETLTVSATGTSKTVAGKKAFAAIFSMALISASDATANTVNLGWGNVLGLKYRIAAKSQLLAFGNGALDTSGTVVVADDNAASASTGDVRGTYAPNSAPDGTKTYEYYLTPTADDKQAAKTLFGVTPA
jgi:hypothetical protein